MNILIPLGAPRRKRPRRAVGRGIAQGPTPSEAAAGVAFFSRLRVRVVLAFSELMPGPILRGVRVGICPTSIVIARHVVGAGTGGASVITRITSTLAGNF